MRWFDGDIEAAVAKSKSEKAVFVVFVEGKDDTTQEFIQALENTEVSLRLETDKFVAIKMESDSNTYKFFTEIYKLVPVPSIFFIGENGRPLEIVTKISSPSDLLSKIDSILAKINPHSTANVTSNEQNSHSSSSNQANNNVQDTTSTNPVTSDQTTENSTVNNATNNPKATANEPSAAVVQEGSDDKNKEVERAKLLIEQQNKKKIEDERKERNMEIERRKMGKDIQKWRKEQHDRLVKEEREERLRQKAADAAAKEKILRQINEDKLERKKKFEAIIQEKNIKRQNRAAEDATKAQTATTVDMTKARIQFRFPAGNVLTGTFEATSALETLRTYVIQNSELPFKQFSMSAFCPRRDFTSSDDSKTLLELELVPSSVLLILPNKSNSRAVKKSDDGNIFSFFFWTLLAPVISIYNYVMGYFRGRPDGGKDSADRENRNPGSAGGAGSPASTGSAGISLLRNFNMDFVPFSNLRNRRTDSQRTTRVKSTGNIHTLNSGDNDNDNDENNTWNGNSTQQM